MKRKEIQSYEDFIGEKQELADFDYTLDYYDYVSNYENTSRKIKRNLHKQEVSREENTAIDRLSDTDRPEFFDTKDMIVEEGIFSYLHSDEKAKKLLNFLL